MHLRDFAHDCTKHFMLGVVNGPFKNTSYESPKIFVKFLRYRSLDFSADCPRLGVSNFCKVVSDTGQMYLQPFYFF